MTDTISHCRVLGSEYATNDAHRRVLDLLIQGFPSADTTILCEPSLHRSSTRPPDVVVVDPIAGVHVIEVKGYSLPNIEGVEPGGGIRVQLCGHLQTKNPLTQVRQAMFDIKNTVQRFSADDLLLPFKYWVTFPNIRRSEWAARWGNDAFCPPEFQFADDMRTLADHIRGVGHARLRQVGAESWSCQQLNAVGKAFGDSSVLYPTPGIRPARRVAEGVLGEQFDEAAEAYKTLSDEQQQLSQQNWQEGPRLVRGVAGSGKTIVLANNLARRLQRQQLQTPLFQNGSFRMLAVCNNRSLVPFLKKKIDQAYEQRTGALPPEHIVEVRSYNGLMYHLKRKGLFLEYQRVDSGTDEQRARHYLAQLEQTRRDHPDIVDASLYDAIYVDEGQDFAEDDFRLIKALCRVPQGNEPNLYIFYDDAQNFLGRRRPNWLSLGLNVRGGRSTVMSKCFRNTRPIVEAAFNVLYGTCGGADTHVPTQQFSDLSWLKDKQLVVDQGGFWKVQVAVREGRCPPTLTVAPSADAEAELVVTRLRWLIETHRVRPQDILILGFTRKRMERVAEVIRRASIKDVHGLHLAFRQQDRLLCEAATLTLSTTASAKGYDAYCVLLVSANEFHQDVNGRISFYIGCTRAIEYLEVFAYRKERLVMELEHVLARQANLTRG